MNTWNQLLAVLDKLFAKGGQLNSRITQTKQGFDNEKNEHIVRIEYRYRLTNESVEDQRFPKLTEYAKAIHNQHHFKVVTEADASKIARHALKQIRDMKSKRRSHESL